MRFALVSVVTLTRLADLESTLPHPLPRFVFMHLYGGVFVALLCLLSLSLSRAHVGMVLVMVLMLMKNGKREDDATIHIIVETNFQVRSPVRLLVLGGSLLQFIRMKRAIFVPFAFSLFKNKTRESATSRYIDTLRSRTPFFSYSQFTYFC